jgi:hypothetical protein
MLEIALVLLPLLKITLYIRLFIYFIAFYNNSLLAMFVVIDLVGLTGSWLKTGSE